MIDKGKYASHGVYMKKISQQCLAKRTKAPLAIINPIASTKPRVKPENSNINEMKVNSKTFDAKFKFQQPVAIKPLPSQLTQPFMYIEKVLKAKTMTQKDSQNKKVTPFVTSKIGSTKRKNTNMRTNQQSKPPKGYNNLLQYETDKRIMANKLFQKILQADIDNIKDLYNLWNKNPKRKLGDDINIEEEQFVEFVKELIPSRISISHIKHFFDLYRNKQAGGMEKKQDNEKMMPKSAISIRSFSYNYSKYKKTETQITNIMSDKASKERYKEIKLFMTQSLKVYPSLKTAMHGIKEYQQTLRQHFRRIYESYQNPFAEEIAKLQQQLAKPIIKYDKAKKQQLEQNINKYEEQNKRIYENLIYDYSQFIQAYQSAIVRNHDLFFTKRTVVNLLKPIIDQNPYITRDLISDEIQNKRYQKQKYLETLSDIVIEIDTDKKNIMENLFTLGDIVYVIEGRKRRRMINEQQMQFTIASMKKLIKQIKRQFLKKNNLVIQQIDEFPADQQLPIQILHTCFQMQCTKVLFKNQIWDELLQMLPQRPVLSRLHQLSVDSNTCMEYMIKYFKKLDERAKIQLNKSKQISMIVENAYNQNFGHYASIINKVCNRLDYYVEGLDQQQQLEKQRLEKEKKKKRVGFADVLDTRLAVNRGEENALQLNMQEERAESMANNLLKLIHQPQVISHSKLQTKDNNGWESDDNVSHLASPVENLSMLKTLARSYFEPEAMNTNAFDIRFYEKMKQQENKIKDPKDNQQLIQLGTSMLLMGAPKVEDIQRQQQGEDPLRISRFLLKTIDHGLKQSQKVVKGKQYQRDIVEGVSKNYFREKIKLQNKPTRYDSEGKSKYSVLLPVGYYESYIVGQNVPDEQKWYLRSHHVETLTENPLSKKDNVIHTQYQSKLEKLGAKKRPDEFVIEENVKRKQDLIGALQQRLSSLKRQIGTAQRNNGINNTAKVPTSMLNNYYQNITQGKEDKQLELAAYEGVLYDLRRKQRQLLNDYRQQETNDVGEPNQKWWERKDKNFNHQLKKDRKLLVDSQGKHRDYVNKLKNNQIY